MFVFSSILRVRTRQRVPFPVGVPATFRAGGLIDQTDLIWTEAKFGLALGIAADALPHAGDASTVTTRAPIAREVTPAKAGKYLVGRHPQDQQSP
jgi:hypothetical protein